MTTRLAAALAALLLTLACGSGDAARPMRTLTAHVGNAPVVLTKGGTCATLGGCGAAAAARGETASTATMGGGAGDDREYNDDDSSGDGYGGDDRSYGHDDYIDEEDSSDDHEYPQADGQQQPLRDTNPHQVPPSTYPPQNFRIDDALKYYRTESRSLLKRSLLAAGFPAHDTAENDESYLDLYLNFAIKALTNEKRKMETIRDARKQQNACSADDRECNINDNKPPDEAPTARDSKQSPEFGHFLTPHLKPGQADVLRWEHSGGIVQDYAARVGLPPQFLPTIRAYAKGLGLFDIMTNMLYDDPLAPNGARWFSFRSPYQEGAAAGALRNFTWNVERPAKNWKSDMHWFNTADELSHEDALRALARGGFDEVLAGIGTKFGLETLNVDSFGFVAVTACERGFIHTDWEDVDGMAFNFLVGIHSPEDAGPELVVEGAGGRKGETYYGSNAGVLVGDGTRHGTRECDHRARRGVRITASIYLADPSADNLDILAGDTTSVFPPTGEGAGREWIWAQRGRHWRREGGGQGLGGDVGRRPFVVEDYVAGCTEEDCVTGDRNSCLRTCRVFMHDSEYKPGKERREVLGY